MRDAYISVRCPKCEKVEEILELPHSISEGLYTVPKDYFHACERCGLESVPGDRLEVVAA